MQLLVCVAVGVAVTHTGAAATAQQPQPDGDIVLSGRIPLARLVDLSAERLDLSIEYDPASLNGDVTLRLGKPLTADELWSLTNTLLTQRGFATVSRAGSGVYSVVPIRSAAGSARVERPPSVPAPGPNAGFRSVIVDSTRLSPARAVVALQQLASPDGVVSRIGDTRLLLLADRSAQLDGMLSLLNQLDGPGSEIVTETVGLTHRSATEVIDAVNALSAERVKAGAEPRRGSVLDAGAPSAVSVVAPRHAIGSWRDDIQRADSPRGTDTRSYDAGAYPVSELAERIAAVAGLTDSGIAATDISVLPDELTGTLFVTATPMQHERVRSWLDRLAATQSTTVRRMRTIPIRNRSVEALVELLDAALGSDIRTGTTDGSLPEQPLSPDESAAEQRARSSEARSTLSFSTDTSTNSLIATGTPADLARLESVVKQLDVRQSQVMLDLILVSLNEGDTRDLGVELQALVTNSGTLVRLASLFGLTSIAPDDPSTSVQASGGTAVVLDPGDFSAVVRALETVSRGRSLIRPKLLVANNEEASLDAVEQQPFISTNASDTVATTSFGGTQDAGTTVSIQPQITSGEQLSIRYSVSLSTFVGESADPALPPARQQNSVSSVATIPDGYAIAIGGIANDTEGEAISKVPILGDIPLLGELFKSRSASRSSSRFYVLIQARILRDQGFEDLKYLSDVISEEVALDPSLPPLEPRVIR
jgi:general secretion pathway protein D